MLYLSQLSPPSRKLELAYDLSVIGQQIPTPVDRQKPEETISDVPAASC